MKRGSIRTVIVIAGVTIVTTALGVAVGTGYTQIREHYRRQAALQERSEYLTKNLQGISIASEFPDDDFPLLADGKVATVKNLLPHGGLVLFMYGECASCGEALAELGHAIDAAPGSVDKLAIIVADCGGEFTRVVTDLGLRSRVLMDQNEVMIRHHGLFVYPCYFQLDAGGAVVKLGADVNDAAGFLSLLTALK